MPHSVSPEPVAAESTPPSSAAASPTGSDPDADVDMEDTPAASVVKEENPPEKEVKLEDIFDDMDDDDFPPSISDAPMQNIQGSASDPEVMRSFYQRLFPWRYLFQWLNHGVAPTNDFAHREFAYTLQNDAYLRYRAFPTADLLRKDVLQKMPSRFEIGPVYSTNPMDRKSLPASSASAFKPIAKELCFDIDLTDYDDIRTCCDKANICLRCWQFITMAVKVVDTALREDFGFRHIMWVYSGRRGAHAWVCDKEARQLDDARRRAIAGYLEVVRGSAQAGKKVNVRRPLHPHLVRSLDVLRSHFQDDVLSAQDPWSTPERAERLLALLPDKTLNETLRQKWAESPRTSAQKWADIDTSARSGVSRNLATRALLEAKQDIVLEYTYPRLDIEVSKKLNHLLKSPFVVHPGTGRVCVPIDVSRLEEFDPLGVPTVHALLAEIDAWDGNDESKITDWEKTSLKPYIEYFRSFVSGLIKDEVKVKREREESGGLEF